MRKSVINLMARICLLLVLGLAGCGGGGDQNTTQIPPAITSLQNTPDLTSLAVKSLIIFDWQFDFTDTGGDLRTGTYTVINSSGDTIYNKTMNLIVPAGKKAGTLSIKSGVVAFSSVGTYTVNMYVTDTAGMNSNTLTATFTVLP
ncbi:MAG: hypothetical protein Q8P40_02165 [Nitrospirota bacterium]|nr:hypothetical protein [Nitrospirota bacterium]